MVLYPSLMMLPQRLFLEQKGSWWESNCTSVTAPDGLTTHYEYDALNRNTRIYKETS